MSLPPQLPLVTNLSGKLVIIALSLYSTKLKPIRVGASRWVWPPMQAIRIADINLFVSKMPRVPNVNSRGPNTSRWNIVCVGHFALALRWSCCFSFLFALGTQRECCFWWNAGHRILSSPLTKHFPENTYIILQFFSPEILVSCCFLMRNSLHLAII